MKSVRMVLLLAIVVTLLAPPSLAAAQETPERSYSFNSGLKIRGAFHVNRSAVRGPSDLPDDEAGYGLGLDVIGRHIGVSLYGYTAGQAQEFDSENTPVIVVLEGNYFYPIERFRLAPYVGVHTALGEFTKDWFSEPSMPKPQDSFNRLGYQVGLRFKPIPVLGLDVQWRKQSDFAHRMQDQVLERTQVLVGFTLF